MYKYLQESELNGDGEGMDKVKVNLLRCKNKHSRVWGIYLEVKKVILLFLNQQSEKYFERAKTDIIFAMNKRKSMTIRR